MVSSASSLILMLAGVGFIGFGVAYALWPARMAALTDLTLESPTARADFIATYGGFQTGFGLSSWPAPGRPPGSSPGSGQSWPPWAASPPTDP